MPQYAMVNHKSLQDFKTQVAIGMRRPQLAPDAFAPSPPGAFDAALSEGLSSSVTRGLDALEPRTQKLVMDYLRGRLGRDRNDPDEEETDIRSDADVGAGDLGSQILDFLHDAGVDPKICERVEQLLDAGNGTLRITHRGDQDPSGGPSSGYDPLNRSAGAMVRDEPEGLARKAAFAGAPRIGGGQVPLSSTTSDRHAARTLARFGKIADAAGHISYAKDMPLPRKPSSMAMDSASRADFIKRFPDAARIGFR
jgi:hypothetical protein